MAELEDDVLVFDDSPLPPEDEAQLRPEGDAAARELLASLVRGKWTALAVFVVVTGLATWTTLREPPLYEAEASLMVRIGREYVYHSEVGRSESARTPSLSEIVNSEVEILSSRDLAEQVVHEMGVERLYPELLELVPDPHLAAEIAVLQFRKAASIRPVLESSVIKVGFQHEVPELAADAVNLPGRPLPRQARRGLRRGTATRLEAELDERMAAMTEAESKLAEFKRTNGVFDLDDQRHLLLDRREHLEQTLQATEPQLAGLRLAAGPDGQAEPDDALELPTYLRPEMKEELLRQRSQLELALHGFEPSLSDHLVEQASLRLLDLQLQERELLRDYNASNRKVQSVQEEIQRVRDFLQQAETRAGSFDDARRRATGAQPGDLAEIARLTTEIELLVREEERQARLEAKNSIQVLELQRTDTLARMASVDAEIRSLDQQEQPLRRLERDLATAEAAAQTYRERVDEARITDELDREKLINVRVIEKAAAPVAPAGLPRNLKLVVGGLVGLIAGVGIAVLLDLFRTR
jgi:uncharacterized protein involved in exopolysaccharide biosynthesis